MKTFWILEPSPYKSARSINAIIYANVVNAQNLLDRPLTRQEIVKLIKKMQEREMFESKQESYSLYNSFMANMKSYKLVQEGKPEG